MTKQSQAAKRASRLREFHDCDQEYRDTRDKEAMIRRAEAMSKHGLNDFVRAQEEIHTQRHEASARADDAIKRYGLETPREVSESELRRRLEKKEERR